MVIDIIFFSTIKAYAYTDKIGRYKITFPKGSTVSQEDNRSSDYVVKAIHPDQIATISIETFEDERDTSRFFRDPVDFAKYVPLQQLKKNCPRAELYKITPINYEGYKGLECSLYCNQFYYTDLYFIKGHKIIFILATFLDDQSLGMTVKKSISSFKIIQGRIKQKVKAGIKSTKYTVAIEGSTLDRG